MEACPSDGKCVRYTSIQQAFLGIGFSNVRIIDEVSLDSEQDGSGEGVLDCVFCEGWNGCFDDSFIFIRNSQLE